MTLERGGLIAPIAVAAALAAGTYWLDRVSQLPGIEAQGAKAGVPDVTMQHFRATQTGINGVPQYIVTAQRAMHYQLGNYTDLFGVRMTDYTPNQPVMRVDAADVRVTQDDETFYFGGNVHMVRDADARSTPLNLVTTKLWSWPRKGMLKTDSAVEIWNDTMKVTAVGMELDRNTQIIKLKSRVRATYVKPQA
ncbi:LPS export ABC transporter periplasmic protein LptC [Chitinivorax sp. PXF-14]|uniref:LPS export ABC transporter periplasmic protein LptC n=1 Tax=Chitinivorax sp. PXF-14 TaxID=3230488 RepID=UPI003464ED7B